MSTTKRDQVMDYYWLQFLAFRKGDFSTEKAPTANFWHWFYTSLSGGSDQAAKLNWGEALQTRQADEPAFMVRKEELTS